MTENEKSTIEQLIRSLWDALSIQDEAAFQQHAAPGWTLVTAIGNRFSVEKMFSVHKANLKNFQIESSNLEIHLSGSFAWATYDATLSADMKGDPWGGEFVMTNLFEKQQEEWKCIHMHETRKPEQ